MDEAEAPPPTLHHTSDYRERRAAEYRPIGDQLDAMIKAFAALTVAGHTLPPEAADLIEHSRTVKARFPKPQA